MDGKEGGGDSSHQSLGLGSRTRLHGSYRLEATGFIGQLAAPVSREHAWALGEWTPSCQEGQEAGCPGLPERALTSLST